MSSDDTTRFLEPRKEAFNLGNLFEPMIVYNLIPRLFYACLEKNMPIEVNIHWLKMIWSAVTGDGEWDESPWKRPVLNLARYDSLYRVTTEALIPDYFARRKKHREQIKEAFRYALNYYTDEDFDEVCSHLLLPFIMPREMKALHITIWEIMFLGEDWLIENKADYIISNDRKDFLRQLNERK